MAHPDVTAPPIKESHWWGKNRYGWRLNYTRNIPFKDYVDIYDTPATHIERKVTDLNGKPYHPLITGDASVSTLWSNDRWWTHAENCGLRAPRYVTAHHVAHVLPQARVIVILRDPTDRLYSDFLYFQTTKTDKGQEIFHEEVQKAISSLTDCVDRVGVRACVYNATIAGASKVRLRVGLYSVYLREWLDVFPREQIHVVRLEDYSKAPRDVMEGVHAFLGLRQLTGEEAASALRGPAANTRRAGDRRLGGMMGGTRRLLEDFYRPYNEELASLLKDDSFLWHH